MSSALDRLAQRAKSNPASPLLGGREIDIPLEKIRFDPSQPRKAFHHLDGRIAEKDAEYIEELAATIKERGLIQAITVQEMDDGSYLVVVGECRTRAHLLLGSPTIRAVVRNDLTNKGQRLLYQIAENVNRQDLTDDELAGSVHALIKGGDGLEPMSQVQIAKTLGKAEGWVSRLVRFGEEEQQRLWVRPGIVMTIENVYRMSILPKAMQVDVIRRVGLPEGHPEWLAKPLDRKFIDSLTREAKISKNAGKLSPSVSDGPSPVIGEPLSHAAPAEPLVAVSSGRDDEVQPSSDGQAQVVQTDDTVGKSLAASVIKDYEASNPIVGSVTDKAASTGLTAGKYELPADARLAILGSALTAAPRSDSGSEVREAIQAPVNCRISVVDVLALLSMLQSNDEVRSAVDNVQCDLIFPGPVAQLIANQLAGVIVDRREVPAVLQRELAKLH
jgi:ParB family transcriptional regulator, chromosome partitioning protein